MCGNVPVGFPFDPEDVLWFGRMLQEKGVNVRGQIGRAIEAARNLGMVMSVLNYASGLLPNSVRVVAAPPSKFDLALATATIAMIRSLRKVHSLKPELLDSAWRQLACGCPVSIPQDRTSERDHIWEILNAGIYCNVAESVQLNNYDAGPDLRGTFQGIPWGIECKVLYTEKTERRIDRIIDGVKQLEGDESIAKGVVVANVTDCIDHARFQRSITDRRFMFQSAEEAVSALKSAVREIASETCTTSLQYRLHRDKFGQSRDKCRALIYIGQTVALAAGRIYVFFSQFSSLRSPSAIIDRDFVNRYHDGWIALQ